MSGIIYKDNFVGIKLYGFCEGCFGRDSYDDKLIIANGEDWVVVQYDNGRKDFTSFDNTDEMWKCISKWRVEEE